MAPVQSKSFSLMLTETERAELLRVLEASFSETHVEKRRTEAMVSACIPSVPVGENPGVVLGGILGVAARNFGRDKVTIVASTGLQALGAWLEQLLAESTGKDGAGLIPIDREAIGLQHAQQRRDALGWKPGAQRRLIQKQFEAADPVDARAGQQIGAEQAQLRRPVRAALPPDEVGDRAAGHHQPRNPATS